jgi:hypothetical protein
MHGDKKNAYKILDAKSQGKRLRGERRHGWVVVWFLQKQSVSDVGDLTSSHTIQR